ncbi:hypothetical protein ACE1SV_67230 [Streptomyces sp. E-15]
MTKEWARTALSHPAFTGISRAHLGGLIDELAGPWTARCESALHERRGGTRRQRPGAGPKHDLVFTDRVSVTLVHLRHQLPHAALAELYGLERSTITRAIGEIRPLPAARGFAVPDQPGLRLHTPADVFAYAAAEGITLRIDGTETQVRRPRAHRPGRCAFVSGKKSVSPSRRRGGATGRSAPRLAGECRDPRRGERMKAEATRLNLLLHRKGTQWNLHQRPAREGEQSLAGDVLKPVEVLRQHAEQEMLDFPVGSLDQDEGAVTDLGRMINKDRSQRPRRIVGQVLFKPRRRPDVVGRQVGGFQRGFRWSRVWAQVITATGDDADRDHDDRGGREPGIDAWASDWASPRAT